MSFRWGKFPKHQLRDCDNLTIRVGNYTPAHLPIITRPFNVLLTDQPWKAVGTNLVRIQCYIVWRNMKRIALYLLAWAKSSTLSVQWQSFPLFACCYFVSFSNLNRQTSCSFMNTFVPVTLTREVHITRLESAPVELTSHTYIYCYGIILMG